LTRTLITGGFGFLATWTAAALSHLGHDVVLVDQCEVEGSSLGMSGLLEDEAVTAGNADVTQQGALDEFGPVDYVVHAAAVLGVTTVRDSPVRTLRVNVDGTRVALDFASRVGCKRFLLFSTSEVYGDDATGASEDSWLSMRTDDPRWSYAVSKIAAESWTYAHHAEHGLPFAIVRPFNVFGALRTGGYAVSALTKQALADEPITVHGDGLQRRAWCHVEDFTYGLVACLLRPEAQGQAFNLGDDRSELTVTELAERIVKLSGSRSVLSYVDRAGPDISRRRPDISKARDLIGYRPQSEFDDRLLETIQWIRDPGTVYKPRFVREDWGLLGEDQGAWV
jgi:nucleoside-diphosphate-sugar epimerase